MKWINQLELIIGVWILVSPWILGFADIPPALWSSIVSGAGVALLGMWGMFGNEEESD